MLVWRKSRAAHEYLNSTTLLGPPAHVRDGAFAAIETAFQIAERMRGEGLERWMDWADLPSLDAAFGEASVSAVRIGALKRRLQKENAPFP
jgi:hypothetical protein